MDQPADLLVYAPGLPVKVAGNLNGRILSVEIRDGLTVWYTVGYWNGNTWEVAVLPDIEVQPFNEIIAPHRIGFTSKTQV